MKKRMEILLLIFLILIATTGCIQNKDIQTGKKETVYIGDNSKVISVVDSLPYPEGVSYDTIEIQSKEEPYELKVFLDGIPEDANALQECADKAFEKISNMEVISFYEKDSKALIKSYERR